MVSAKRPAQVEKNVSSASVNVGDIVLVYSSDGSLSDVTYELISEEEGTDGGYIKIYVIQQSGTVSISTSETADVIHTGKEDAIDVITNSYYAAQYGGEKIFARNLSEGDILIQWDEDPHGDTRTDWDYTGGIDTLLQDSEGAVDRWVLQASSGGDATKTEDTYVEHNAIALSLVLLSGPTNLIAEPTNDNNIEVSFTCSKDPHHFELERRRQGGPVSRVMNIDGDQRSYKDTDVTTGIKYIYQIKSALPVISDYQLDVTSASVNIGDLVVMYENGAISNVSYNTLINTIGFDGGHLKVFLIKESGTVDINVDHQAEIIHTGRPTTNQVDGYSASLSKESASTGVFMSNLEDGDIIIQWDESDVGDESGYYSFTGELRNLYTVETSHVDRMLKQVFSQGDISRDVAGGVELAAIKLDLSPGDGLIDTFSDKSNKDSARTAIVQIDTR